MFKKNICYKDSVLLPSHLTLFRRGILGFWISTIVSSEVTINWKFYVVLVHDESKILGKMFWWPHHILEWNNQIY